jgi:hypothetical protein
MRLRVRGSEGVGEVRGIEFAKIVFDVAGDLSTWRGAVPGRVEALAEALSGPTYSRDHSVLQYLLQMSAALADGQSDRGLRDVQSHPYDPIEFSATLACSEVASGKNFMWQARTAAEEVYC